MRIPRHNHHPPRQAVVFDKIRDFGPVLRVTLPMIVFAGRSIPRHRGYPKNQWITGVSCCQQFRPQPGLLRRTHHPPSGRITFTALVGENEAHARVRQQRAQAWGGEVGIVGRTKGFDAVFADVGMMKIAGVQKKRAPWGGAAAVNTGEFFKRAQEPTAKEKLAGCLGAGKVRKERAS
jgi:hypothetical protein